MVVIFFDLAKRCLKTNPTAARTPISLLVALHAEHRIQIDHPAEFDAQFLEDMPAIRFKSEANLDDLIRVQQLDQERQPFFAMHLKQVSLVVQGKLHHVRPFTHIADDKRRFGFGIETNDARSLDCGSGGCKLFLGCRHMDVLQREADKRLHQRDLILGWGGFFHSGRFCFNEDCSNIIRSLLS